MGTIVAALRRVHMKACRHWLILIYIAVVVTAVLVLAIREALA